MAEVNNSMTVANTIGTTVRKSTTARMRRGSSLLTANAKSGRE